MKKLMVIVVAIMTVAMTGCGNQKKEVAQQNSMSLVESTLVETILTEEILTEETLTEEILHEEIITEPYISKEYQEAMLFKNRETNWGKTSKEYEEELEYNSKENEFGNGR